MPDGYSRGLKTKDVVYFIKEEFSVEYTNRNCRYIMRKMNYSLLVPRPRNKRRNQESVDEFKRSFKKKLKVWTKK